MTERIKVGYVGWLSHDETEFCTTRSVCDVKEDKLAAYAGQYPDVRAYRDYREMAADPELDLAVVSTPNHLHCEMGVAFLDAGKHVFLEKPMGIDRGEMNALLAAQERSGRQLAIDFECRASSGYVRCKEILDAGELGDVRGAEFIHHQGQWIRKRGQEWRLDPDRSGGLYFECICHYVDLMRHWLGEVTHAQSVKMPNVLPQYSERLPDNILTHLFFESGAVAHLTTMHAMSVTDVEPVRHAELGHDMAFILYGTRGALRLDVWTRKIVLAHYVDAPDAPGSKWSALKRCEDVSGPNPFHDVNTNRLAFIRACAEGRPHHQDAADAWRTFAVCEAAEQSALNGFEKTRVDYGRP